MIDIITNKFLNFLNKFTILNDKEKEIVKYTVTVILTDISKTIILFSIFLLLDAEIDLLIMLIYSAPLRINVGGFHMKKYLSCLTFSAFYFILIWQNNHIIVPNQQLFLLLGIISTYVIYKISPVLPKERIDVSTTKLNHLRKRGISLSIIYIVIYIIVNNPYTSYGIWIVIIQSILILIAKGVNSNEKNSIKKCNANAL